MSPAGSETRFAILIFSDVVGSMDLKARYGVPAYSAAIRTHNQHFERIVGECRGIRILQNLGDGYFAEADSVTELVRFALLFQDAMRVGPWGELRLTTRVGIHAGEVASLASEGGSGLVSPAADLAARVMSLAVGGQILLTRFPFDEARHFIREHPAVEDRTMPSLRWLAHGPYLLKGRDEPLEIFEVGADGLSPLRPPPDGEKAKRAIRPGEEETLGWRPAVGLEIPGRPGWQLTEKLGAGGFGEVWIGEHAKLRQRCAFKFCFDDERLRALKREVTLVRLLRTALGDRDDIVRLHELKLDEPPFYLESDLAPHGNLLQWAEKQGGLTTIPLAQRIALVAHTATALAAAHSIGVLHKDIKPTNILIFDAPDGSVRPRLVDFGIGTLSDPATLVQHGITAAGFTSATIKHSTGTPTYSPPEYLAGKPYTIQGDIYGLGVLLYQLVTAKPLDPLAVGWERDITDPLLRDDIATCVDGDPARRLQSAADLADRLFHLDQRRAEIGERERLAREAAARAESEAAAITERKRATRFRKLASGFAVLAMLAIAGGVFAWVNQRIANAARAKVVEQKVELEQKKSEVDRKNADYRAMLVEAARSDRVSAEEDLRLGRQPAAFAHLARACEYDPPSSKLAAEKAIAALNVWLYHLPTVILAGLESNQEGRQFGLYGTLIVIPSEKQTARVWEATSGKLLVTLAGTGHTFERAEFSRDGKRIITTSIDERIARVWDAATGRTMTTLAGHEGGVRSAEFSPDGKRIVTASHDNTGRVWDATTGNVLATLTGHLDTVRAAEFSSDSKRIVTLDGTARVWDATTGKVLAILAGQHESALTSARFSPDDTHVVTASLDKTARVWDATTGRTMTTLAGHEGYVLSAEFSPDGTRIVTASADKTARVWDAATGRMLTTLTGHAGVVNCAHFSPDGTGIVTASYDKTARVWDVATGKVLAILAGHQEELQCAQFSRDGMRIVTASTDRTARVWDVTAWKTLATLARHEQQVISAQFNPDGKRIVTASHDNTLRVWDATTGTVLATLAGHQNLVRTAEFSSDGKGIVTSSWDGTARVWDATTGKMLANLAGHERGLTSARFSPDDMRVVTLSGNTARVWDATTGKTMTTLAGQDAYVLSAEFSPDGTRIVTASEDKPARVWDAANGRMLITLAGYAGLVNSAHFSPSGTRIVTAAYNKPAGVWDAATGETLATLSGHEKAPSGAQFSPDGNRIVTASEDKTARVWDATTGKPLATLAGHEGQVISAQFNPDGTRIVTASLDKTARVWDAATGKAVATLLGHESMVTSAQFSPDGTRIVTAAEEKTARIWTVLPPSAGSPPDWFPDFLRYMAQMRLNSDGELETLKAADWLALRGRLRGVLRASAGQDTPYLSVLRKFVPE